MELSYRNFQDWQTASRSFTKVTAMGSSNWTMVMDRRGESVRIPYTAVTSSFFETLGARPFLGRTFQPGDDVPNAAGVIVLNYGAWVRRFGADPRAVGATITLDDRLYTIVGVMPKVFDFPRRAEFWTPVVPGLTAASAQWGGDVLSNVGVLFVIGRLREGVALAGVSQELDELASRLQTRSTPRFGSRVTVTPFLDYLLGPVRAVLWLLFAAVGVLLVIASANISGLMLTRASLRRQEQAIRLALGASPLSLVRLWILEALALSTTGGILGLVMSRWMAAAIVTLGPDDVPRLAEVSINLPVAAFACGLMVLTALLCGIGPVRPAGAASVADALKHDAHVTPGRQLRYARSMLSIFQIALSVVLLVSAGLIVRSFAELRRIDLGFTPAGVLTMNLRPRAAGTSANDWLRELLTRIETLPHVKAAGAVYLPPLALGPVGDGRRVILEGQPSTAEASRRNPTLNYQVATPGYFRAMAIRLKRGRLFDTRDDGRSPPVVIIGETTARLLWPGEEPIGKRLAMPTFAPGERQQTWRTVVGVVADVRYRGIDTVLPDVYDAAPQASSPADHVVIRTDADPLAVVAAVQASARALDPRVVIDSVTTMDRVVSRAFAPWRLSAWMLALFAMVAFALAGVGLFSLVSLDVASRRHEFAVRLALGAVRRDIARIVLVAASRLAGIGVALGLLAAIAGTRALRGLLFGVEPLDAVTYVSVVFAVISVVALASYLPARRIARIDPLALRSD